MYEYLLNFRSRMNHLMKILIRKTHDIDSRVEELKRQSNEVTEAIREAKEIMDKLGIVFINHNAKEK